MSQPFRLESAAPAQAFQTYALERIPGVHTRPATCEQADCKFNREGWETRVDVSTELGQQQAAYITRRSGRRYSMEREGDILTFVFTPGQQCFTQHQVSTELEPLYIVRGGDHRGNPTGFRRRHVRAVDWVEDMGEHLDKVREDKRRG